MSEFTHRFRMVIGKEQGDVMRAEQTTEEERLYFELVETVAGLGDDEEVDIEDERFEEILQGVGKDANAFIADCISRRDN